MLDFQWRFPEMPPSLPNQAPMEREFFVDEPINTRIVRESIQNSLDAAADKSQRRRSNATNPVRVRFSLSGISAPLPPERAAQYFDGLAQHLRTAENLDADIRRRLNSPSIVDDGLPFIVIEDAGTIGLTGDWRQFDDTDAASARENHFYWFFRNVGRSAKTAEENGSWGLGKWVFPDASHASCYIAVTRRRDDTLLISQTVLSKHSINGRRYAPYGYLGLTGDDGLTLPLRRSEPEHRPYIDQCIADFGLKLRSEPGLSIIIPFPKIEHVGESDTIDARRLLTAIVHNYFYPIVAGWLEVSVDRGDDYPEIDLSADTIDDVVSSLDLHDDGEYSEEGYRHLFALCREALALPEHRYTQINKPPSSDKTGGGHREIINLRNRYDNSELLAFNIATEVRRKVDGRTGKPEPTYFKVYLQRDNSLDTGHDYYVRGTLSIPEIDLIGKRRARTLLVVDESQPLGAMLRDSEPPNHKSWRPQTDRVTRNWTSARQRVDEVRRTPGNLLRLLEAPPEGRQKDVFADIFPWHPEIGQSNPSNKGQDRTMITRRDRKTAPPSGISAPPDFSVSRSETGFRVISAPNAKHPLTAGDSVRLRVAYEVSRGNPLNSYQEADFRLHGPGALNIYVTGAEINPDRQGIPGNRLDLNINDPHNFALAVQGFDRRRDLHIRVETIAAESTEATENADDP